MDKQIKLEIEELEERIAPAPFAVNPPGGPNAAAGHVPSEIDAGAAANARAGHSGGVVSIGA